jgi:hypothetical protein
MARDVEAVLGRLDLVLDHHGRCRRHGLASCPDRLQDVRGLMVSLAKGKWTGLILAAPTSRVSSRSWFKPDVISCTRSCSTLGVSWLAALPLCFAGC